MAFRGLIILIPTSTTNGFPTDVRTNFQDPSAATVAHEGQYADDLTDPITRLDAVAARYAEFNPNYLEQRGYQKQLEVAKANGDKLDIANAQWFLDWMKAAILIPISTITLRSTRTSSRRVFEEIAKNAKAMDPNALVGPGGYGPQNFIQATAAVSFTIDFENDGSVAAQDVTLTEQPLTPTSTGPPSSSARRIRPHQYLNPTRAHGLPDNRRLPQPRRHVAKRPGRPRFQRPVRPLHRHLHLARPPHRPGSVRCHRRLPPAR